jgi:hypothetical protein
MLVSDVLNYALAYIGAYGPGEAVSSDDQAFALVIANNMLDGLSAKKLSPLGLSRGAYPLTGVASYTYGPAMTWNAPRPLKIKAASTLTVYNIERPCTIADAVRWAAVLDKSRTGAFSEELFWDGGFPTGVIYVTPMPPAGQMILETYGAVAEFVNLTDTVSFPLGYQRAVVLNLALELCIPFGRPIPEGLPQLAQAALLDIQTLSAEILGTPQESAPPPAQPGQRQ